MLSSKNLKLWSKSLGIADGEKIDIDWKDIAHVMQQHTFEKNNIRLSCNQGILTFYSEKQGNSDKYRSKEIRMKADMIKEGLTRNF